MANVHEFAAQQTWESNNVTLLMATRGLLDIRVVRAYERLIWPMNIGRVCFDAVGLEVADAYNQLVETAITHPTTKDWPFILTTEEDNLPEPAAFTKLLSAIRHCPDCREPIGNKQFCSQGHRGYDGIAGLYFTKVIPPSPMAFGDPKKDRDFTCQNVVPYIEASDPLDQLIPVNAIPMGFSLYRSSLFRELRKPWFQTLEPEMDEGGQNRGAVGQDLYMCLSAKEQFGGRFAVHCGVRVGHLDIKSGKTW